MLLKCDYCYTSFNKLTIEGQPNIMVKSQALQPEDLGLNLAAD